MLPIPVFIKALPELIFGGIMRIPIFLVALTFLTTSFAENLSWKKFNGLRPGTNKKCNVSMGFNKRGNVIVLKTNLLGEKNKNRHYEVMSKLYNSGYNEQDFGIRSKNVTSYYYGNYKYDNGDYITLLIGLNKKDKAIVGTVETYQKKHFCNLSLKN